MKSIKEKAEENCIKYGNLGNVAYQEFESGANYVLDAIENIIINNYDNTYNMVRCLVDCIEQLKK